MSNSQNRQHFLRFLSQYRKLSANAPRLVGINALDFYKTGFKRQGQIINGHIVPWQKRGFSPRNRKKRSLLRNTGALFRSLNYRAYPSKVILYSNLKYAAVQNDGATIKVTAKMRRFFYAMWKASGGQNIEGKAKHGDKFWLAMMKAKEINIPKRPIFYDTPDLAKRLDRLFQKEIEKILKNL